MFSYKIFEISRQNSGLWDIMQPIIAAGETYALDVNSTEQQALNYWFAEGNKAYGIFQENDTSKKLLGTCYLRRNRGGNGGHVSNAGFMVHADARGQGVAQALCQFAIDESKRQGYKAIQFNYVVSCNVAAVNLWQKMGFKIIGRTPNGFNHPKLGYVDSLMMWREV